MLKTIMRDNAVALTLQNGVEASTMWRRPSMRLACSAARTYVATALAEPGIVETDQRTHRRIVFGETSGEASRISERVRQIHEAFAAADIVSEPVADARVPIWGEVLLSRAFRGVHRCARVPVGPIWSGLDVAAHARVGIRRSRGSRSGPSTWHCRLMSSSGSSPTWIRSLRRRGRRC